jgi:proteasome lid subunit RPN8/RPN11
MTFVLHIPSVVLEDLRALARAARPLEIVGLLGGQALGQANLIVPLENAAPDPTRRFEADFRDLARGFKTLRASGLELCALYHSHPDGPATPSKTDLENAHWDVPMLIVDANSLEVRAWDLQRNLEIELRVV